MSLPTFSYAEFVAESYEHPRLHVFQHADSPTSIDLHWKGGYAKGADIACALIEGCKLDDIAVVVNHSALGHTATIGVNGAEAIATIRSAVAAKAERAA